MHSGCLLRTFWVPDTVINACMRLFLAHLHSSLFGTQEAPVVTHRRAPNPAQRPGGIRDVFLEKVICEPGLAGWKRR